MSDTPKDEEPGWPSDRRSDFDLPETFVNPEDEPPVKPPRTLPKIRLLGLPFLTAGGAAIAILTVLAAVNSKVDVPAPEPLASVPPAHYTVRPMMIGNEFRTPNWTELFEAYQLEPELREITIRKNVGATVDVSRVRHQRLVDGQQVEIYLSNPE